MTVLVVRLQDLFEFEQQVEFEKTISAMLPTSDFFYIQTFSTLFDPPWK